MKRLLITSSMLASMLAGATAPAMAYNYSFQDEYWLKAGTPFSSVFAGVTGNAPAQGLYQETITGASPVVTQLTTTTFTITGNNRFNTDPIPGEFTQDDGNSSAVLLNGWTSSMFNSGANGVSSFEISKIESNPAAISLTYVTGITNSSLSSGTLTAFNLNSIDLFTAVGTATGYIVEGLLGGVVQYQEQICTNGNQYAVAPVNGSCGAYTQTATVPFNWSDIDTVEFGFLNNGVFQTGWPNGGTLNMDNIDLTPFVPAVPEPASLALLGVGLLGLGFIRRRLSD